MKRVREIAVFIVVVFSALALVSCATDRAGSSLKSGNASIVGLSYGSADAVTGASNAISAPTGYSPEEGPDTTSGASVELPSGPGTETGTGTVPPDTTSGASVELPSGPGTDTGTGTVPPDTTSGASVTPPPTGTDTGTAVRPGTGESGHGNGKKHGSGDSHEADDDDDD